jgi:hypothetical protein
VHHARVAKSVLDLLGKALALPKEQALQQRTLLKREIFLYPSEELAAQVIAPLQKKEALPASDEPHLALAIDSHDAPDVAASQIFWVVERILLAPRGRAHRRADDEFVAVVYLKIFGVARVVVDDLQIPWGIEGFEHEARALQPMIGIADDDASDVLDLVDLFRETFRSKARVGVEQGAEGDARAQCEGGAEGVQSFAGEADSRQEHQKERQSGKPSERELI